MSKIILITGATDGIGKHAADKLLAQGHHVILHGRSPEKLAQVSQELSSKHPQATLGQVCADLSDLTKIQQLVTDIKAQVSQLDILINNAGVYKIANPQTAQNLDARFAVNTIAPYLLTLLLKPLLSAGSRVVNLSSAAQAPVNLANLTGEVQLTDAMSAYAQSKLAITSWSIYLAEQWSDIVFVPLNPGSLLGTKMVQDGWGIQGGDINIGADIICRAALDAEFANKSGQYFDNDSAGFARAPAAATDPQQMNALIQALNKLVADYL